MDLDTQWRQKNDPRLIPPIENSISADFLLDGSLHGFVDYDGILQQVQQQLQKRRDSRLSGQLLYLLLWWTRHFCRLGIYGKERRSDY